MEEKAMLEIASLVCYNVSVCSEHMVYGTSHVCYKTVLNTNPRT